MSPQVPLLRDAPIVGNFFRDDTAKDAYQHLELGNTLQLELEPTNEHDPFAVKVLAGGIHVGYIPRTMSAVLYAFGEGATSATAEVSQIKKNAKTGTQDAFLTLSVSG